MFYIDVVEGGNIYINRFRKKLIEAEERIFVLVRESEE